MKNIITNTGKLIQSMALVLLCFFTFLGAIDSVKAQAPTISSFAPISGNVGTTVTIVGTNFNTTTTNNVVFFGATRATVTTATAGSLTVTLPTGATYAPITVLNTETTLAAYSLANFTPTFTPNKGSITVADMTAKVDFTTGINSLSVAIGDLDGDGKPDLVIANSDSNTISVFHNTASPNDIGAGSFAPKVDFTTGSRPYSVAIGDLDGDGKLDLLVANFSSNSISVFRNTAISGSIGAGSFAAKVDFATGFVPNSVTLGDLDGDGKPELAVANGSSNTVSVFRNTSSPGSIGAGSFAAKVDFNTGSGPFSVAIGDLDGDGKLDLVVANFSSNSISVFRNTAISGSIGAGSFGAKVDFNTGSGPFSVAIGDLDGDGKLDLLVANLNSNTVSILRNMASSGNIGAGSFAAKVDFTTGLLPYSVTIGDLDGDGKPDLAVVNHAVTTLSVFRNTAIPSSITASSFAAKVDFATGSQPFSVAIGDLDGDGKPDLAVANQIGSVSVLRNNPVYPPTITSFTPTNGCANIGVVTITGINFIGASAVTIGGVNVTSFTVDSSTSITALIGSGNTGTISVTGPGGIGTSVSNFTVNPLVTYYRDVDGDGYGNAANSTQACTFPVGYVLNSTDCNDNDNTKHASYNFYTDSDHDGYGMGGLVSVCAVNASTPPTGYSLNNTDCVDSNSTIKPGAIEICSNGIDDNCNGQIDEGCLVPIIYGFSPFIGCPNQENLVDIYGANFTGVTSVSISGPSGGTSLAFFVIDDTQISVFIPSGYSGTLQVFGSGGLAFSNQQFTIGTLSTAPTSINGTTTICIGSSTTLMQVGGSLGTGGGSSSYEWRSGSCNGIYVGSGTSVIVSPTTTTTYFVRAYGSCNTTTCASTTVTVNPLVTYYRDVDVDGFGDVASSIQACSPPLGYVTNSVDCNDNDNTKHSTFDFYADSDSDGYGSGSVVSVCAVNASTPPAGYSIYSTDCVDSNSAINPSVVEIINGIDDNCNGLIDDGIVQPPTITSFSPISGAVGTTVTITGTNFNVTPTNNVVFFGATRATVTAATETSLTVIVPTGATYAPITVLNTETALAAYSLANFNPIFTPNKGSITAVDIDPKVDFTAGENPINVAIGDLDGDGKPDLAVANQSSATVSVFRNISNSGNIGTGSFAAKVDFTTGSGPISVAIGDLDGDGKPDLAVANEGSSTVSVLRNTASIGSIDVGSFAAKVDFATGSDPLSVVIGDLDGDGKPDLVVANGISNTLSVFHNTAIPGSIGVGSFASKVDFNTGNLAYGVAIGDFDGDGKPDLAVANYSSATVSVFRNTASSGSISSGSFATKVDFTTGSLPQSVAIGDLDGDGKLELAVANYSSATVSVLHNTANTGNIGLDSFAAKIDFPTNANPASVAIGDLDGDGKPDLAVANTIVSGTASILRNTTTLGTIGINSFASKVDFNTGNASESVTIGDLDGDGKPDLVIANSGSNSISILRNNSIIAPPTITSFSPISGMIGTTVTITGTNFNVTPANNVVFFGATRATVTAATETSLTVIVPTGASYAPITELNTGTKLAAYSLANFTPTFSPTKGGITAVDIEPKVDFTIGSFSYSVAIGDLDGDGKADLALTNYGANTVSVLRNTATAGNIGEGSFDPKVDFATGTSPRGVSIGDLDGDGKSELVVANFDSNTISVLHNTANPGSIDSGSFDPVINLTSGSGPISIAISDLDGDGKPELAVANHWSNSVSVFRNTATSGSIDAGFFAAKVDFTSGGSPDCVAIGDLDGDGKPELAVANQFSSLSVFHNTAIPGNIDSGSFAAKVDFDAGAEPLFVAIGDLDGDGKPELTTVDYSSSTVSVFRNTTTLGTIDSGSFAAKVDYATGAQPYSVAIGDLDGDGKPDLAVPNINSASVSVFRNTATLGNIDLGSFAAKVDYDAGSSPNNAAIGDLDGDGKSDLAVANAGPYTVSVFRNNPIIIPPTITSFSPIGGVIGTTVTITGTNFNATPANNVVFFGATRATVTAATETNLTVIVPTGATYAPITVLNTENALAAYSLANFNPTFMPNKGNIMVSDFTPKVDFTTGAHPTSIAIGDLDGDGKPDLALANLDSNTVSVFRNISSPGSIGTGSFAAKVDFTTGTSPISVTIGDLDGDGKPELVVANINSSTASVFHNTTTPGIINVGSFAAKIDFITGGSPRYVAIFDLDGDGKPELSVPNQNSDTVSVLQNTASLGVIDASSFAVKVDFNTGLGPFSVAVGDLDGDSKPDLAVTNIYSASVSVFHNAATQGSIDVGSFAPKVDYATGLSSVSVVIGDLDGDNKPELAVTNSGSNAVSVLLNTASPGSIGAGSFAAKIDFATGLSPYGLTIGDLDGDSKPDLAVVNYGSGTLSVFHNMTSSSSIDANSFTAKIDFIAGSNPTGVAIGDLDGDGKPELMTANNNSNTVSILRNNPVYPPNITSFTPSSGCANTTEVSITGTNFTNASAVTIGSVNVTSFTVHSDTAITAIIGSGTTGVITVTNSGGTGASVGSFMVNPILTPTIVISTSSATICSGNEVAFTADITNGGASPVYQWKVNGVNAGTNSASFNSNSLVNGDAVSCYITSNANCASPLTVTSNSVEIIVTTLTTFYRDADSDGFGNAAITTQSCGAPVGYVQNSTDCDDANTNIYRSATLFVDTDGDGYDNGSTLVCYGSTFPVGYSLGTNGSDCNDNDVAKHISYSFYIDADHDGFGFGKGKASLVSVCAVNASTPPLGYSLNNTDCNDTNPAINPGAVEICFNGIDDNCNGKIDEGCIVIIPKISINDIAVYESVGIAVLTVSLSSVSTLDVKVNFSTVDGTALGKGKDKDYTAINGFMTISSGSLTGIISVPISIDNTTEGSEYFDVLLSKPTNATILDNSGRVTIINGAPLFAISSKQSNKVKEITTSFTARVFPNPTIHQFTLIISSDSNESVRVGVYDLLGRQVYVKKGNINEFYNFGDKFPSGIYIVEVKQGDEKIILKAIKKE